MIRNVLLGLFEDKDRDDEPMIVFEQPRLDETARKGAHPPAGWTLVLKYFEQGLYKQALQTNAYLVVHIDTDVSDEYGVAKPAAGKEADMLPAVVDVIRSRVDPDIWASHGERFIFAVAIHSIECWLLPPLFDGQKAKQGKVTGCFDAADKVLQERRLGSLRRTDGPEGKNPDGYADASKAYRKRRELMRHKDLNVSLAAFVAEVERRAITIPAELP